MGLKQRWAGWSGTRKTLIIVLLLVLFLCTACGLITLVAISRYQFAPPTVEPGIPPPPATPVPPPTPFPPSTPVPPTTPVPPSTPVPPPDVGVSDRIEVHVIDVGQGDAILLRAPDATVLIDGGESNSGVVPYLQRLGVQKVDVVVATHPHADHIGGLIDVLQQIPVDRVVTNGQLHTTLTYERFLDAIADAGAEYIEVARGDVIRAGSLVLDVLHPESLTDSLNDGSVVLRLTHGSVSFLLTGDIEKVSEDQLVASGLDLRSQILKVPHHASRSSSSTAFLQRVQPEVAIYCAGVGNRYGHPHDETLAALAAVGAQILGTDVHGTVVVTTDGETYQMTVERPSSP
jgi:competence protein ComEC